MYPRDPYNIPTPTSLELKIKLLLFNIHNNVIFDIDILFLKQIHIHILPHCEGKHVDFSF